ncbi:MAG: Coenzyme F420 hydrogenase/dehydrogenase, beta subunit C-terminal domain [Campylobacterota bacterium]
MLDSYQKAFVGYSNNITTRLSGSSGGIGTEMFQYLLEYNLVDGVIGVGYDENDPTKSIYKYIDKASDVSKLTGSKYLFMGYKELVEIIEMYKDKNIAVIAQPCFTKSIRKKYNHIQYIFSFFCGYNITKNATNYLIKKSNIQKENIQNISYRGGNYPGGFTIYEKNGNKKTFGKQYYELVDLLFLRKGCNACGYYISADADIVLGDAWLKNVKSSTLILVNTNMGDKLLKKMFDNKKVTLSNISKDDIWNMHKHNIKYKKYGHSKKMAFIVKLFNNTFAQKFAPFYILGLVSKVRRVFAIGIIANFSPIKEYK